MEDPCGLPATLESGQVRCRDCRLIEDQATLPESFSPDEESAWRRRHRARPDVFLNKRFIPGEEFGIPSWRGCRVEVLAFTLGEEGSDADTSTVLVGYPWHFERFPRIDGPCIIVRWRLYHPGKPGFLVVTWDGMRPQGSQERVDVRLGPNPTTEDAGRLASLWTRSTAAVLPPRRGGRPKHYTEANESEFFEDLKRAAHAAVRGGEEHLTPTSLARYGLADRRTIGPALVLYGYDLTKVEAEAIRCAKGGASFCTFHVRDAARFKENGR